MATKTKKTAKTAKKHSPSGEPNWKFLAITFIVSGVIFAGLAVYLIVFGINLDTRVAELTDEVRQATQKVSEAEE